MLFLNFLSSISLLSNMVASTNSTAYRNASLSSSIEEDRAFEMCTLPTNGLPQWCYEDCKYGYNLCSKEKGSDKRWAMLNAYRSGGKEKYHWKYTTNKNDLECLQNWTCYASNGKTKYGTIVGRVTQMRDRYKKLWCALPVYRRNGKRGLQWDYCSACPSS